jgi:1-acyl-sn-glycerol-3-phosphate acyltransferase
LFKISSRAFFNKLEVKGLENIPLSGPVILLANHPSTFMDPIVIGATTRRKIFFLAKAEVFKSAFTKWLLPKFNMIPIYRAQDDPTQMHKNKETFQKCFDHFRTGGAMLIFPEGISLTERKLKKIKTGAARIALGAEADNDFALNLQIVCVGLNYSNPHRFQSDLLINIDAPISVKNYQQEYLTDGIAASNKLTDEIKQKLESIIVSFEDNDTDKLAADIETIYRSKLLKEFNLTTKYVEDKHIANKAIAESVNYFKQNDPTRIAAIKLKLDKYFSLLNQLKLNDRWISKQANGLNSFLLNSVFYTIGFLLGFPIFLFGLINNYLPYKIPYLITKKITDKPEYYGAFALVIGTFTFLIFYTAQLWLVQSWLHNFYITITYLFLLPISGFFAFYYATQFRDVTGRWMLFNLFLKKSSLIATAITMRESIIDDIQKGHKDYVEIITR